MHLFPVERTQGDDMQKSYSNATRIDFTGTPELTRQEQKAEADIQYILAHFGINTQQRAVMYGDQDTEIDLQQAFMAREEMRRGWHTLPDELKAKYPSWQSLIVALNTGELTPEQLKEAVAPPPEPPPEPPKA